MTHLELAEATAPTATTSQNHHEVEATAAAAAAAHSQQTCATKAPASSPDPMSTTDRYRLVTPYLLKL